MGGMIAQELCIAAPERVDRLVLACTYARATQDFVEAAQKGAVGVRMEDLASITPEQLFERMLPYVLSEAFLASDGERIRVLFRKIAGGFSMRGFLGQLGAVFTHDATDRLAAVRAPTLVVTGTADRMVPHRCSERLAELIPGATLRLFHGASHGFNFEIPEAFGAAILQFLDGAAAAT